MLSSPTDSEERRRVLAELIRLHKDERVTVKDAAAQLHLPINTARRWLARSGVSNNVRVSDQERERACRFCGKTFQPVRSEGVFCSRQCTNDWQRSVGRNIRCPCGNQVGVAEGKHFYASNKKYCSSACRRKYGAVRQADPAKSVMFRCRHCGVEVTRRRNYGSGHLKYCSNKCASHHTKKKHHLVLRDDDVVLDSAWEALVWGLFKLVKEPVERFDRSYGVRWDPGRPKTWYAPDFWLPRAGLAVEVKGADDPLDEVRWEAYRHQRGPLLVLTRSELLQLVNRRLLASWTNAVSTEAHRSSELAAER